MDNAFDKIRMLKTGDNAGKTESSLYSEDDVGLPRKISSIEQVLEDMRDKLRENAEGHAEEIRTLKEEIEGLK